MRSLTRIPFPPAAVASLVLLALAACSSVGSSGSTPAPQGTPQSSPTVPVKAPAEVFETIDIGDQSGVADEGEPLLFVAETEEEWRDFWFFHSSGVIDGSDPPAVDFSREMVIAAVDQAEPSGGYGLEITGIEEVEGRLVVRVSKTIPGPDCIVITVITQPFHVVRMAKSDLEPELLISEETYSCG